MTMPPPLTARRRIVAVTGEEAEAAIALADDLAAKVAAAGKLPVADMQSEVKALTQAVSGAPRRAAHAAAVCHCQCGRQMRARRRRRAALHQRSSPRRPHASPPVPVAGATIPAIRKAALTEALGGLTRIILDEQKKAAAANKEKAVAAAVAAADAGGWGVPLDAPRAVCCA